MKRMIMLAAAMLALGVAAQSGDESRRLPVLSLCKGGKLVGIRFIAPAPDIYTIAIPPDVCAPKPKAAPPRAKASAPFT